MSQRVILEQGQCTSTQTGKEQLTAGFGSSDMTILNVQQQLVQTTEADTDCLRRQMHAKVTQQQELLLQLSVNLVACALLSSCSDYPDAYDFCAYSIHVNHCCGLF